MLNRYRITRGERPKVEIEVNSLKARKRLSLNGVDQRRALHLPKATIQTIIKKQTQYRTLQSLLNQEKILCSGLYRGSIRVFIYAESNLFYPNYFTSSKSESYYQALMKARNIKTLSTQNNAYLPFNILWPIRVLRTLQALQIFLFPAQFLIFPKVLTSLASLRSLDLTLKNYSEDPIPETITEAFSQLSKALLRSRNLISFKLNVGTEELFPSGDSGNTLLSSLGQLNLQFFEVVFQVSENSVLDPNKIHSFLKEVEHLSFAESRHICQSVAYSKIFCLRGKNFLNLDAILMSCSSLKSFEFRSLDGCGDLPQSLGSASGISELDIFNPLKPPGR